MNSTVDTRSQTDAKTGQWREGGGGGDEDGGALVVGQGLVSAQLTDDVSYRIDVVELVDFECL